MLDEEATKLLGELGISPDQPVEMSIRIGDMFVLNELVSAATAWAHEYAGALETDEEVRLYNAIKTYIATDQKRSEEEKADGRGQTSG